MTSMEEQTEGQIQVEDRNKREIREIGSTPNLQLDGAEAVALNMVKSLRLLFEKVNIMKKLYPLKINPTQNLFNPKRIRFRSQNVFIQLQFLKKSIIIC